MSRSILSLRMAEILPLSRPNGLTCNEEVAFTGPNQAVEHCSRAAVRNCTPCKQHIASCFRAFTRNRPARLRVPAQTLPRKRRTVQYDLKPRCGRHRASEFEA